MKLTYRCVLVVILLSAFPINPLYSKISEKKLQNYRELFIQQMIKDNPGEEYTIRLFLSAVLKERNVCIKIKDKFALFMDQLNKKNIEIQKIRFFPGENRVGLHIVLKNPADEQLYSLLLDYEYNKHHQQVSLSDVFLSYIYDGNINEFRQFFQNP